MIREEEKNGFEKQSETLGFLDLQLNLFCKKKYFMFLYRVTFIVKHKKLE